MTGIHPFSSAVQPKFSGDGRMGFATSSQFHTRIWWWTLKITSLSAAWVGGSLSDCACFFRKKKHHLSPSRLRPSSFCWEPHLLQELKSHRWLLSQLLWNFSSSMPFTLPTRMFLSCLLDVTHISAKTPHLSQAQAIIIARSSLKQFFMPLALQKHQLFLPFMLYVDLATQAAFLEKERHPAGKRS